MTLPVRPAASLSALLLGGLGALTLTTESRADTSAELARSVETGEVIIVTATRTYLADFDYPGLVSAIDLDHLDRERPSDLAALLQDVPGLEVAGGPRRTGQTLNLRGFGREGVTVLVDGARQNFASAHDGVLFLDPGLIGRVETVRGAASALYGSGAAGGVIAFETLEAGDLLNDDDSAGFRASAGYRSVNAETRGSAALFAETGEFEGIAAVSLRQSGDIRLGSGDTLPARDDVVSGLLAGEWDLSPSLEIEAGWLSFRNQALEPNNGQNGERVGPLNALMSKTVASDAYRVSLSFEPDTPLLALDLTAYHNVGAVDERETASARVIRRDLQTTGLRLENRAAFNRGALDWALLTGLEWYQDEQIGFDSETPDSTRGGVPSGVTEFTGAWAQLEATLDLQGAGRLIVLPGVRFDRFESRTDGAAANENDALSPRFAATYAPNESLRMFASWSEAFRAPSLNELYLSDTHFALPHPVLGPRVFITNTFIANPDLKPERTETVELGAGLMRNGLLSPSDRFELKGAWFRTQATDLINLEVDFAFDPGCFGPPAFAPCSAGSSFSENLASAELEGFEVAAAYTLGPLELSGALFEIDGKDTVSGAPLGALQPVTGHLSGRYRLDAARLTLGGRIGFAAAFDRTTDPRAERDSYAVLDLYAGWRPFAARDVRIDLGVENVFDEDYDRVFAGVSEPGRTLRLDLTWTGGF